MNARRHLLPGLWLIAPVLSGFAAEPAPAVAPAGAALPARFKQIRERIDALYQHRNHPFPPPTPAENPFRPPGPLAANTTAGTDRAATTSAGDTGSAPLNTLQQALATLHVSGIFEIGGQLHLVINTRPYKVGDVVQATVGGQTVYLRIREIVRTAVTLALDDAEMTLKFGTPPPAGAKERR